MDPKKKCIILLGPTAAGKTAFGVRLADRIHAEIISADSRQVYCGLDIGSGKDLEEYTLPSGKSIAHHLMDIADPAAQEYSLADFIVDSEKAVNSILSRKAVPLFVGGTALYLHALLSGYELHGGVPDPGARAKLNSLPIEELRRLLAQLQPQSPVLASEANNRYRLIRKIELSCAEKLPANTEKEIQLHHDREYLILGLYRPRAEIHEKIALRLDKRLRMKMLDEAIHLHEKGVSWERLESFGLEYREMALYLQGKKNWDDMQHTLLVKIRQFAKRQDSWFRKIEREGFPIHWVRPNELDLAEELSRKFL